MTCFLSPPQLARDKAERLAQAEALDFISKLFTLINNDPDNDTVINNDQKNDTNSDCKIDANKVLKLLEVLEVPWDYQLAVKLVLDQVSCVCLGSSSHKS